MLPAARALEPELIALRRDLHRHPELSFRETRTAAIAADRMRRLGWQVRTEVGRTGVVAELPHGPGPTVALRADMDALPIQEQAAHDYGSTVPGVMHACGHDAHVAILVGAAAVLTALQARRELPAGTVRLLFQPSEEASDEEGRSGAQRMIDDGAMAGVARVFGLHVGAHLPSGIAFISPGPIMAGSAAFRVTVRGRSVHAARPHEGVDALVLAAHGVLACQNAVARRLAPDQQGVLTIGTIRGGTAENVLADAVELQGTIRYFDDPVRAVLERELRAAFAVAAALGGRAEVELRPSYPPVVNDEAATALARVAVADALGAEAVAPFRPMMGAEDFALLARAAPGCFFWLGAALPDPREHHSPTFDIDESVLATGAAALAACAVQALHQPD
ncbi:MAG: amidohydrolase [Gemmatimonadetes bacterium]|nr:amidohydrolase [Gemmatimonadota bacterium]